MSETAGGSETSSVTVLSSPEAAAMKLIPFLTVAFFFLYSFEAVAHPTSPSEGPPISSTESDELPMLEQGLGRQLDGMYAQYLRSKSGSGDSFARFLFRQAERQRNRSAAALIGVPAASALVVTATWLIASDQFSDMGDSTGYSDDTDNGSGLLLVSIGISVVAVIGVIVALSVGYPRYKAAEKTLAFLLPLI